MSNSTLEELEDLLYEGKIEETQRVVDEFDKKKIITEEDKLRWQIIKGSLDYNMGNLNKASIIGRKAYRKSLTMGAPLLIIKSIYLRFYTFILLGRTHELEDDIEKAEKILESAVNEPQTLIQQGEALLRNMKGWEFWSKGKYDIALESIRSCLEYFKNKKWAIAVFAQLGILGHIYEHKGELELALRSLKKCLEFSNGSSFAINLMKGSAFIELGSIYYQQGNLDQAIESFKKSLEIFEQSHKPIFYIHISICWIYNDLIRIFLDKNSLILANEYLHRFSKYIEQNKISYFISWYKLSEARILKSSTRIRDRAKAEKILRKLLDKLDFRLITQAIFEICDFYLGEISSTNDLKILDDIQPLITLLLKESERTNAYSLQSHTSLLQGKLSLLQMNMGDARRHLTQSQRIAEEHGLSLLARSISIEHDKLLEQLGKWENMKKSDFQISERLNLASLGDVIGLMQGKRALELSELINEEPLLLLIMSRDGESYFTHSFKEKWNHDDLFSSFMSAFNTFSSEIFSESIDRIKIGGNLILIKSFETFLVCYIIKGQSYPALQKLTRFSDAIKWNTEISDALNKSAKTGEMLELSNPSSLGDVVNEIFKQ